MKWLSGKPVEVGYYFCAIIGEIRPIELYWDGASWNCLIPGLLEQDDVVYYINPHDIPMPEGWL